MSLVVDCDVVIPTTGRPSLLALLEALERCEPPVAGRVLVVDDSRDGVVAGIVAVGMLASADRVELLRSGGRGPAAARNRGWHAATASWVAFLDDDVLPPPDWTARLAEDLGEAGPSTAAVQGRIVVPLPRDRRLTDWERQTAGLQRARWATADLACRRLALEQVGGFDERFRRNYREDADLGLRLTAAGGRIATGGRTTEHPVGPASRWVSVVRQAGNADDVLMDALHGRGWRERAAAPRGRLRRHLAIAAAGLAGAIALARRAKAPATICLSAWAAGTAELAWARIAPGPREKREVQTMLLSSVVIPFAASAAWLRGHVRVTALRARARRKPAAVLLDRDDTLIVDRPYNGDPAAVQPMPTAREALAMLRAAGVATAVVSNQSGIGRGLLSPAAVSAVNARVEELLGPLGPWVLCPHGPKDGCGCRKPAPGLVLAAAHRLGVDPRRCVLIGDIAADVQAAEAAGAEAVLVPTARTKPQEIATARRVAPDLVSAVRMVIA